MAASIGFWKQVTIFFLLALFAFACSGKEKAARKYETGVALYEKGEYDKARETFDDVLTINSQHAKAHMMLGKIARAQ
jgi:lipopolysaccharide biosynthesis regulator YciM